jgi:hypothetical protein
MKLGFSKEILAKEQIADNANDVFYNFFHLVLHIMFLVITWVSTGGTNTVPVPSTTSFAHPQVMKNTA